LLDFSLDLRKFRRRRSWRANDEDQIPAWGQLIVGEANCLANAPTSTVALDRFANSLPNHKSAARSTSFVARDVQRQERCSKGLSLAPHSLKLVGLAEAIGALHNTKNREPRTENPIAYAIFWFLVRPQGIRFLDLPILAVTAADGAALVTDSQPPAPRQAATLQDRATVFSLHSREKAMLTTTWNAFWLPGSLWHWLLSF
jgi:hypothetical protein